VSTPFAVTSFAELSWEQLGNELDSELRAAFLTTKAAVPGMVSRGFGRLIYGYRVIHVMGWSRWAPIRQRFDQFVRYVALELAPHGITANLVAPGKVEGPKATELVTAERMHKLSAANPMRQLVRPEEVAETVAFLASEESSFTTGHYLPVRPGSSDPTQHRASVEASPATTRAFPPPEQKGSTGYESWPMAADFARAQSVSSRGKVSLTGTGIKCRHRSLRISGDFSSGALRSWPTIKTDSAFEDVDPGHSVANVVNPHRPRVSILHRVQRLIEGNHPPKIKAIELDMESTNWSVCGASAEQIATMIDRMSINCPTYDEHALVRDDPVVDAVDERTELAMPMAEGFSFYMVNTIMSSRADEIVDLVKTNLWRW
jgi:hypothetical protein